MFIFNLKAKFLIKKTKLNKTQKKKKTLDSTFIFQKSGESHKKWGKKTSRI
jgi:hypothetical protein